MKLPCARIWVSFDHVSNPHICCIIMRQAVCNHWAFPGTQLQGIVQGKSSRSWWAARLLGKQCFDNARMQTLFEDFTVEPLTEDLCRVSEGRLTL